MAVKYPVEYDLNPKIMDAGTRWVTLNLRNIGDESLTALDIKLNSLDAYNLSVFGTGRFLSSLEPGEEQVLPFQVSANATGSVYISLDGWQEAKQFHWESPAIRLRVGKDVAELVSLLALTEPHAPRGESIRCEATVQGMAASEGLALEFWAETPDGRFEELASVETKELSFGEKVRYSAEIVPQEEGLYTIYAYLYDGDRRIGRQVEHVHVS